MNLPIWARVLLGVAVLAYIAWEVHRRWRAAGAASDAMFAEKEGLRAVHKQLLQHPGWQRLWRALAARGYQVSTQGPQPGAFHLGLLMLGTDGGYGYRLDDPTIRALHAYLQGPKKIVASLVFATGEVHVRDVGFAEWPAAAF